MSAQRSAASLGSGDQVPWRSLEHSAFEGFPEVVAQLRQSGGAGKSNRKFSYFLPLALLVAAIYAMPIWGLVTVLRPRGLSQTSRTAEGDITVAGVIFGVALVALVFHTALWFWSGRPPGTALVGTAAMAFFLGSISACVAVVRGTENAVPAWELWFLPMVACAVLGGIVLILVLRARRRTPSAVAPLQPERVDPDRIQAVRDTIGRVADEDQRLIRGDLTAAIDGLERRGVITAADADRARTAELGELAFRMAQPRTSAELPATSES